MFWFLIGSYFVAQADLKLYKLQAGVRQRQSSCMGPGRVTLHHSLPGDGLLVTVSPPRPVHSSTLKACRQWASAPTLPSARHVPGSVAGSPGREGEASCWCGGSQASGLSFQELPAPSCLASCPSPSWKPSPPNPPYRASVSMVAHQACTGRTLPFTFHTEFGKQLGGKENHTMASNWEVLHYHCDSKVSAQGFYFLAELWAPQTGTF